MVLIEIWSLLVECITTITDHCQMHRSAIGGGARARVLAEEDDEEGAQGGRRCGRAARNPILSAHLRVADDLF